MHHRILQIGLVTAFAVAAAAHVLVACTSLASAATPQADSAIDEPLSFTRSAPSPLAPLE